MHSWLRALVVVCVGSAYVPAMAAEPAPVAAEPAPVALQCPVQNGDPKPAGDRAMLDEQYPLALACYELAYQRDPRPALHYNRARALELMGRRAEALRLLRRFDREAPADVKARVPQLPQLMAGLRAQVVELELECPVAGSTVTLDGHLVGVTPLGETVFVEPGARELAVRATGYAPFALSLSGAAGDRRTVVVTLQPEAATPSEPVAPVPAAAPAPSAPPPSAPPAADTGTPHGNARAITGWSLVGVGALGGVFSLVSHVAAVDAYNGICGGNSTCDQRDVDQGALSSYGSWRDVRTASFIVMGVGLAAGAGVLIWDWTTADGVSNAAAAAPRVALRVQPTRLTLTGRF